MNEESITESHLHLCKENFEGSVMHLASNSKLPSGELSIYKKGAKLYLRPLSPYRYTSTPEIKENDSPSPSNISEEESQCHQRSSTTIINDIAQSYTFIPAIQKTLDSQPDEDIISNTSELIEEPQRISIMDSTIDPKSNQVKSNLNQERISTIKTISSSYSTENNFRELHSKRNWKSFDDYENKHSLLESVMVFCQKCGRNNPTEVVENMYVGTL